MKQNGKRILAIIGVFCILALIIAFIISSLTGSKEIFQVLLFSVWAIPLIIWFGIMLYGKLVGKHTIADLFPEADSSENKESR